MIEVVRVCGRGGVGLVRGCGVLGVVLGVGVGVGAGLGIGASALAQGGKEAPVVEKLVADGQERVIGPWASKELATSPVAITMDGRGNVYVAETARAGNAVSDTRSLEHLNAVEEDLKLGSVEDRRALIRRWVEAGKFAKDFFTKTEDRVRIVRDTDGDGVADWSGVFAGGFNDEVDGIGSGVLELDGTVYYTCIPHLWALRDGDGDFAAEERRSLSEGYGIRWCFFGHDLHGLVLGPDGRIYFSIGDRGYNVTTREGKRLVGVDRGAVFRCWPDGRELELVHEGLRNPQQLAFGEYGDLFTGDNNCDSGDKARIVHIVEGGDSGWRQDVQSLESRGPWNREHMWETTGKAGGGAGAGGAGRPAWSLPPVAYMGAGPSGFKLYPGTGEAAAFKGAFFLVDFYGSGSTVHAFRCVPEGGGFKVADAVEYYKGVTVTDIVWGYDGRLYMSDWGGGWRPNPNGDIFTVTNTTVHGDAGEKAAIEEVRRLFASDFAGLGVGELLGLLGHRDQRVRLRAQYRLAAIGGRVGDGGQGGQVGHGGGGGQELRAVREGLARAAADASAPLLARVHAIWGIGQVARVDASVAEVLKARLADPDEEVRVQAIRVLGDLRIGATRAYEAGLKDGSGRIRFAAAVALARTASGESIGALLELLADNNNVDLTVRHGAVYALAEIGKAEEMLRALSAMPVASPAARLGVVLALRRMGDERVGRFLGDSDEVVAAEAARAVYDLRIGGSMAALAAILDRGVAGSGVGSGVGGGLEMTAGGGDWVIEPVVRRAIEANVIVGDGEAALRLARFAARAEIDAKWRILALERLSVWDSRIKREGVWGNWVDWPALDVESLRAAVRAVMPEVIARAGGNAGITAIAEKLQATHGVELSAEELAGEVLNTERGDSFRSAMLDRLARASGALLADAAGRLLRGESVAGPALRARALEQLASVDPARAISAIATILEQGTTSEKQHAVRTLGRMDSVGARNVLTRLTRRLGTGAVDPAIKLEVFEAVQSLPAGAALRTIVEAASSSKSRPAGFVTPLLEAGGDAGRGREVFLHHEAAQCLRCHVVDGDGGNAGPDLTGIGARRTLASITESVVEPGAVVTPGYGEVSSMPAMTQVMTPRDVRDVVAYLASLKGPEGVEGSGVGGVGTGVGAGELNSRVSLGGGSGGGSGHPAVWASVVLAGFTVVSAWRGLSRRR